MFLYKICIPKKRAKTSSCRNKPRDASLATTTSVLAGEEARATHGKNEKKVSVSVTAAPCGAEQAEARTLRHFGAVCACAFAVSFLLLTMLPIFLSEMES